MKRAKVGLVITVVDENGQDIYRRGEWIDPATTQWDRECLVDELVNAMMPELDAALDAAFAHNRSQL